MNDRFLSDSTVEERSIDDNIANGAIMNYATGLRRAREQAGLSKRKLASLAQFDPSYITHLESGKRKPSLDALEAIAGSLGIPMSVLLLMCADKKDLRGIGPVRVRQLVERLLDALREAEG